MAVSKDQFVILEIGISSVITRILLSTIIRHALAAVDGEEFLAMEGDIGGGLILARDVLVAKDSPDKMTITSRIEARSVGAGSGGFSRLVRLRIRPLVRLDHRLKTLVRYTAIDGKKHVLRGDEDSERPPSRVHTDQLVNGLWSTPRLGWQ